MDILTPVAFGNPFFQGENVLESMPAGLNDNKRSSHSATTPMSMQDISMSLVTMLHPHIDTLQYAKATRSDSLKSPARCLYVSFHYLDAFKLVRLPKLRTIFNTTAYKSLHNFRNVCMYTAVHVLKNPLFYGYATSCAPRADSPYHCVIRLKVC